MKILKYPDVHIDYIQRFRIAGKVTFSDAIIEFTDSEIASMYDISDIPKTIDRLEDDLVILGGIIMIEQLSSNTFKCLVSNMIKKDAHKVRLAEEYEELYEMMKEYDNGMVQRIL